jgi:hypothetical protein
MQNFKDAGDVRTWRKRERKENEITMSSVALVPEFMAVLTEAWV